LPPQEYDGKTPLENARYEEMCKLVASGFSQGKAYVATSKKRLKLSTAMTRASEIFSRPDVISRRNWLSTNFEMSAKTQNLTKADASEASQPYSPLTNSPTQSKQRPTGKDITQDEIATIIATTLRSRPSAAEVASLTGALLKIRPQLAQDESRAKPDPALVVSYIASFAGMTGKQIVRELGGPKLLVQRLCSILAMTGRELREMIEDATQRSAADDDAPAQDTTIATAQQAG
jgi:hypothetical protein